MIMKPIKQTVYLPVNGDYLTAVCNFEYTEWCHHETVQPKEGYFFTPEQLNEYTANVIKQALETAAENARMYETVEGGSYKSFSTNETDFLIDGNSITNTFEETYNKLKV